MGCGDGSWTELPRKVFGNSGDGGRCFEVDCTWISGGVRRREGVGDGWLTGSGEEDGLNGKWGFRISGGFCKATESGAGGISGNREGVRD